MSTEKKRQDELYGLFDLAYRNPLDRLIHYKGTDANGVNKTYTKWIFRAGNHADLKRINGENADDMLDATIDNDQIPGKSVLRVQAPLLASTTFRTMMNEIKNRYKDSLEEAYDDLAAARNVNPRVEADVDRAEAVVNKLNSAKTEEENWLKNTVTNAHDNDARKMMVTVSVIVLDEPCSPRQDDISIKMHGGPKQCAHCVAAAAPGAAGGGAAQAAPIPYPDESAPRMIEVECVQLASFDTARRV